MYNYRRKETNKRLPDHPLDRLAASFLWEEIAVKAPIFRAKAARIFMGTPSLESAYSWRRHGAVESKAGGDWRVDDERR
jgi:hypothetical protein